MIIGEKISTLNRAMNRHLEHISSLGRGDMSQDILSKTRIFIEHIICRSYQKENGLDELYDCSRHYKKMMSYAGSSKDSEIRRLKQFHKLIEISESRYTVEYPDDRLIELAKRVKTEVDSISKYTAWDQCDDIKAELKANLIVLLTENDYHPVAHNEVYKEIFEQAENFKKYRGED